MLISTVKSSFIVTVLCIAAFGALGYGLASLRIPDNSSLAISKKVGGEKLDQVILRAIKFKLKKNRIYLYTKEETKK